MVFVYGSVTISMRIIFILLLLILFHDERILRLSTVTLTNFDNFVLNLMWDLRLKHFLVEFLDDFAVYRFYTFLGSMNHKCDKCKSTTPTATFISHNSNIDNFSGIFEIIFDILLLSRVQNASNKELNINWISCGFNFRRLFHRLS